jgi:uncharacterized protein (TIGR03437 family)
MLMKVTGIACVAVLLGCLPLVAQSGFPSLNMIPVASGFSRPVHITHAGDGSGRLFVVEQAGRIRIVRNGQVLTEPFLDITSRVSCCGERGLLSVAFPPGYESKGHSYVNYTDLAGNTVVARYRVSSDPNRVDAATETVILYVVQPAANHNGGLLAFGPRDGYLYIGMGDGGGAGDPFNNGQNASSLLGKILRIDVESGEQPYRIPPDNPFANSASTRREIWAMGVRNPWRFSFDRATSDLYIADVGQQTREEVNFQPAASPGGENYGWPMWEGTHCYRGPCTLTGFTAPVAEYGRANGCSITGGFVYRGSQYPALEGTYLYGDYCSGRVWGLRFVGNSWMTQALVDTNFTISTFGEDEARNVYVADLGRGNIHWIAAGGPRFTVAGVTNGASFQPGLAPGSIATLFGTGLTPLTGIAMGSGFPLPTTLEGTAVRVNGVRVPLFAVANVSGLQQINFQLPWDAAGTVRLVVENNGMESEPVEVEVRPLAPGIFGSEGLAAAINAAGGAITRGAPAARGRTIALFATGLGPVDTPPPAGQPAPPQSLARTLQTPTVTIAGVPAQVTFSGLAPGYAGLYPVNVEVPAGVTAGDAEVLLTMGGQTAPAVLLPVQ